MLILLTEVDSLILQTQEIVDTVDVALRKVEDLKQIYTFNIDYSFKY